MSSRVFRSAVLAAFLVVTSVQGASARSLHIDAHFTQHFGGRNGEPAPCPNGELICGAGRVEGYGRATDAFLIGPNDEFLHTFTLADGSRLTAQLEFANESVPGASREAPGAAVSFGNPATLVFDAEIIEGTGVFTGASGLGTATLHLAGNVDQIYLSLDLDLPSARR